MPDQVAALEIAIKRTPSETTRRSLRDSAKGKGVRRFDNKDEFSRRLGL